MFSYLNPKLYTQLDWTIYNSYSRWFGFMVFNATFNNISVISWWSVLLVEETGENHHLLQVTDKLDHINVLLSAHCEIYKDLIYKDIKQYWYKHMNICIRQKQNCGRVTPVHRIYNTIVQWNLSKSNLGVQNRQVFNLCRLK